MKTMRFVFFIILFLIGCRSQAIEDNKTPAPEITALSGQPIPVTLSELAAKPAVYEGAIIQLTGQYSRLPRLICESNPQPSPATWGVESDTLLALAGGFDGQLRPLLPDGMTITVAGLWQYWEGMTGCGDTAQPQEIWYLQVSEIISPSPITQVTVTPGNIPIALNNNTPVPEGTAVAPTPPDNLPGEGETAVATTPPINPSTDQTITTTLTATITPSANTTDDRSSGTATPTATATRSDEKDGTPTLPTATSETIPTPSATPQPGTTPTLQPTPTASVTPTGTPDLDTVNKGDIDPESPLMDYLETGKQHQWIFYNEIANNKLTVNTIAVNTVDLAISIIDPGGILLHTQNNASAGQPEIISEFNLSQEDGEYQILIHAANEAAGEYEIVALDNNSISLPFNAVAFNAPTTTRFTANIEQLWFFTGAQNDTISITAVPNNTADIGIDFIGPGDELLEFIDTIGDGVTEELTDYSLPESGLYILWLYGEGDGEITVELTVTRN